MSHTTTNARPPIDDARVNRLSDPESPTSGCEALIRRVENTISDAAAAISGLDESRQQQPGASFGLSVVIPVFNERKTLPQILSRIDEVMPADCETIVVDDASTDGTAEYLAGLPPRPNRTVLLRGRNHGKGSAVRMGIRHSRGAIVAIQDADMEYDPIDLLDVIEPIQSGQAEVVYGSRYLRGSDDPSMLHRLGNWALTAISNCMTGQRLTDMETCHKAFRGDLVRSIRIRECRFGFEPEITGKIADHGIAIAEVPTGYSYRSYEEGKKITWKDGVAALACMWRYRNAGWFPRAFAGAGRVIARVPGLVRSRLSR